MGESLICLEVWVMRKFCDSCDKEQKVEESFFKTDKGRWVCGACADAGESCMSMLVGEKVPDDLYVQLRLPY